MKFKLVGIGEVLWVFVRRSHARVAGNHARRVPARSLAFAIPTSIRNFQGFRLLIHDF